MANLTVEEYELLDDPKYRAYVSAIDKALKYFESTSEWADLISALGKLNKVLLSHIKTPVIPRRIVISKRLAQCMHPALPGGVHLKALETYDIIFKCIKKERLSQELFIYSAGLFPLLTYAAMNVRQALLSVYETHFVSLECGLRPGLPGFLNGVLPGLEEGSEYYDRTNNLLEKVSRGVGAEYFYGCLWDCVLANPCVRLPAVTYVHSHFNRKVSIEDQLYIMGTNVDVMVEALSFAVQDPSVLVQRITLDFLLVAFPMHSSHLIRSDMERLLTSAVSVVLRRDMSLNRRLYSWLLGADNGLEATDKLTKKAQESSGHSERLDSLTIESEISTQYFNSFSKPILIQALCVCLKKTDVVVGVDHGNPLLRPYRLLISLLDKPEISSGVLDDILLEVFRALYHQCDGVTRKSRIPLSSSVLRRSQGDRDGRHGELIKTANLLFGILEPHYIWQYIGEHFQRTCERKKDTAAEQCPTVRPVGYGDPSILELCRLTDFLLDTISVETYVEMQTEHLPILLRQLAVNLSHHCEMINVNEVTECLKLCSRLLSKIQPVIIPPGRNTPSPDFTTKHWNTSNLSISLPNLDNQGRSRASSPKLDPSASNSDWIIYESCTTAVDGSSTDSQLQPPTTLAPPSGGIVTYTLEDRPLSVSAPKTLLRSCVSAFQDCFVKLVVSHLFQPGLDSQGLLQRLLVVQQDSEKERQSKLEQFLWHILNDDKTSKRNAEKMECHKVRLSTTASTFVDCKVPLLESAVDFLDAFTLACQILVDFSSFPALVASGTPHWDMNSSTQSDEDSHIPEWLRLLLVISCFVQQMEFQLISIGTILELMGLTQSVTLATSELSSPEKVAQGTYSVLVDPILKGSHLKFLNQHTLFCQIVSRILWRYLDESQTSCLRKCVELMHQLHNLAPDGNIVENVIGESIAEDDEKMQVKSVQKFAVLWHLSRGLPPRALHYSGKVRLLDRSLLVMLNCLLKPYGPQRAEVLSWLNHSLQRGDIGAILEPILLILLHPDTARVSVQHVSIHRPEIDRKTKEVGDIIEEDERQSLSEAKIYAISSVQGQVIYHVGNNGNSSQSSKFPSSVTKSLPSPSTRRIFALASITGGGKTPERVITENAPHPLRDFELPSSCERTVQDPISVFVNPFQTEESTCLLQGQCGPTSGSDLPTATSCSASTSLATPPNLEQAHRIDVAALRNSFNSFDDGDGGVNTPKSELEDLPGEQPKPTEIVRAILQEIVDTVVGGESEKKIPDVEPEPRSFLLDAQGQNWEGLQDVSVHPLHTYLLLYTQCYDSGRVLYALSTLKAVLQVNPRFAVCTLSTTGIGSSQSPRQRPNLTYELLARHRKAIFGKGFDGELKSEAVTAFRSSMYLEIVVSLCLYYMRSFYPNLAHMRLTEEDLANNWEVQLLSVDLLTILLAEVATVVRDSGKGFASYVMNLLSKCKVQKTLLHCVLSGVFLMDKNSKKDTETFTEVIIRFNEGGARRGTNEQAEQAKHCSSPWDYQETFQISMLRLLVVLIILEDQLANHTKSETDQSHPMGGNATPDDKNAGRQHLSHLKYQPGVLIPCQSIFQTAILTALKQPYTSLLHRHWLGLLSCSLPFLRKALASIVVSSVSRLCRNLEDLATLYDDRIQPASGAVVPPLGRSKGSKVPVDHVILQLEGLTTLCHYCLLDNSSLVSTVLAHPSSILTTQNHLMTGPNATQIIGNLINVFAPSVIGMKETGNDARGVDQESGLDPLIVARHNLLAQLPRIVSSLATLWQAVRHSESLGPLQASWIMGTPKVVQQLVLELLSPISHHHGVNFLAAVAIAWNDKKQQSKSRQVIPACWSEEQLVLVELVRSIKVMPMDTLVQLVRQVVKQPPSSHGKTKIKVSLEVTILQFFYAYVQATPGGHLIEAWNSMQNLIKDGLQLNSVTPTILFLLLGILNEFVQRAPSLDDRKEQKELQDLTQRLVEACGSVAAASLEQTTWLRRNFAVKPGPQMDINELDGDTVLVTETSNHHNSGNRSGRSNATATVTHTANHSVQALSILAELLASLLDVVYLSDEKEKVIPLLTSLMYSVTPYLRNHHQHNVPSFRACSQLLASLSGYQYTRKSWRRDVFDLLLDSAFFQMDVGCLKWWRTIIDNLMTHDKITFSDLMSRVSIAQSGSLNLFSSKEQEYEQRAQLLKRLAFVLFCSEIDQYQGFMPDIQERLAESLRLHQVPAVQAQVFLCFRVLLLRMSPLHITSLWPIIITEMVQVFLQIEQELCRNTEEFSSHLRRLSTLDSSWVVSSSNGLNAHSHPAWLQLYLAVCKLLDLALCLPADKLPQFQMYSWAFIGESHLDTTINNNSKNIDAKEQKSAVGSKGKKVSAEFVPHVVRLARLWTLDKATTAPGSSTAERTSDRLPHVPGRPLLTMRHIRTLRDLQPFFDTVAWLHRARASTGHEKSGDGSSQQRQGSSLYMEPDKTLPLSDPMSYIEHLLEMDFLEPLPIAM